jgi:protein required for attachment to host cells
MANGTATIAVDAKLARAYNAAPKAMQRKVQAALRQALRQHSVAPRLSKRESALFLRINRTITDEQQQQYERLTAKRLAGTLTKREHAELGALIAELERLGVDRLQAVIELARLRKIPPAELAKQLELEPLVQIS